MINNTTIVILMTILPLTLSIISTTMVYLLTKKYFRKRVNNDNKTTNRKYKVIRVILLVLVYIVVFTITRNMVISINDNHNQKYDILGNKYSLSSEIPLYDVNGNKYTRISNSNSSNVFYEDEYGNSYNANDIYLTKGGYIVHPDENKVEYSSGAYDMVLVDDEYYYVIISPYWNENGDLIVDYSEISPEYNIIITKEEQLEYQQEKGVNLFD